MNQDGVCTRGSICVRAFRGFCLTVTCNQGFDTGYQHEIRIGDCILYAFRRPQNSQVSAKGCLSPMNEFILGKPLSSKQIPDAPRCHNLYARRRALLKFPKPESPSTRIGAPVRSAILSTTSTTWVQDASLASRKPRLVDIESPDAHKPLNPA